MSIDPRNDRSYEYSRKSIKRDSHGAPKKPAIPAQVENYVDLELIGEGTYGRVFKARDKITNEIVALKKVRMEEEEEGFPISALREINILSKVQHKNIIRLIRVISTSEPEIEDPYGAVYLVFEYMDHDLIGLANWKQNNYHDTIREEGVKHLIYQLLDGVYALHKNNIVHRDLKTANLLISEKGDLKIGDFGLARALENTDRRYYTPTVITLWYRPPELLLGARQYSFNVDIWSVGCIFAELLFRRPVLDAKSQLEADQLDLIYQLVGVPTVDNFPEGRELPNYKQLIPKTQYSATLRDRFKNFPPGALSLIEKMLTLDPKKRISAAAALDDDYFWKQPLPSYPAKDIKFVPSRELNLKQVYEQEHNKRQKVSEERYRQVDNRYDSRDRSYGRDDRDGRSYQSRDSYHRGYSERNGSYGSSHSGSHHSSHHSSSHHSSSGGQTSGGQTSSGSHTSGSHTSGSHTSSGSHTTSGGHTSSGGQTSSGNHTSSGSHTSSGQATSSHSENTTNGGTTEPKPQEPTTSQSTSTAQFNTKRIMKKPSSHDNRNDYRRDDRRDYRRDDYGRDDRRDYRRDDRRDYRRDDYGRDDRRDDYHSSSRDYHRRDYHGNHSSSRDSRDNRDYRDNSGDSRDNRDSYRDNSGRDRRDEGRRDEGRRDEGRRDESSGGEKEEHKTVHNPDEAKHGSDTSHP